MIEYVMRKFSILDTLETETKAISRSSIWT